MIQTPIRTAIKFFPWLVGILFKLGLTDLSWKLADWYTSRGSMAPASPVISGHPEVVYAKDQPEYNPLPSIKQSDGCVISRWVMPWTERLRVLFTGSIYLEVLTFNQPLQPLKMSTIPPEVEHFGPSDVTNEHVKAEAFQ